MPVTFHDISPRVSERTAVFPGDTPFSKETVLSFEQGGNLHLSAIRSTVHIGAHADAPKHYRAGGQSIDERPLHYYLGPAQVIHVPNSRGRRLVPKDVWGHTIDFPRVIFRTDSFPDPENWNSDFASLSPDLIRLLHTWGVITVGIDTPSIDPADSKELESHQAIFQYDMAVLEGLELSKVKAGLYMLSALPLRIAGADASPVRAVLWEDL